MSIREPPSVQHLRRSRGQTGYVRILLEYIDALADEIDRLQRPLELSDEAILDTIGPATDSIAGKDVWMLGGNDLLRLAGDLLQAAEREREGEAGGPSGGGQVPPSSTTSKRISGSVRRRGRSASRA
jgi:hypothetical protein